MEDSNMPDAEFVRTAYEAHHALFRHYSEQIFKTRISIITLILLFAGHLAGLPPLQSTDLDPLVSVLLAFLSALLVVLLFSNEVAYYRRLTQVVQACRSLESRQGVALYFSNLDHMSHWRLYSIYTLAVAFFLTTAVVKFVQSPAWDAYRLLTLLLLVPPALLIWAWLEFSRTARTGLAQGPAESSSLDLGRQYDEGKKGTPAKRRK